MTAFASVPELGLLLGEDFDPARADLAAMALDQATAAIRSFTGQTISAVANDTVTLDGNGQPTFRLPEFPVTAVASVTVDGIALSYAPDAYDYMWTRSGVLTRRNARDWGTNPQSIVVTYSHGYAVIPDEIKAACLQLAARAMTNPLGMRSESIGSYSGTYGDTATATDPILDALNTYRVPVLA